MTSHQYKSMTVEALAYRAHDIEDMDSVADILGGGEDYRSVQAYFQWFDLAYGADGSYATQDSYAELIGVVIGGDDPAFAPDVLDPTAARAMFSDRVDDWELDATERMFA